MSRSLRVGSAMLAFVLAGGAATSLLAQIPGMPLFTNPRYGTGLRIHGDYGQPTDAPTGSPELSVLQAGVSLALGPIGLNANVGTTKATANNASVCVETPTVACSDSKATVSALAQLRVYGGGQRNISVSAFGGASMDLDAYDAIATAGSGSAAISQNKEIHIPVGVALGYRVGLGVASLNLWAAPRMNLTRFTNCSGTCPANPDNYFAWAVGADFPILRVISIRAAFDSHKEDVGTSSRTVNVFGVGASIGIGGMR